MFDEILTHQNIHWTSEKYDIGIVRSCFSKLLEYLETGQIIAITGVRRAGKSTLIRQLINHLIYIQKVSPKCILFLNLEHPYLSSYREDVTILQRLFEDYLKMMQPDKTIYIFLDEVQFFRDWPIFVKALHETKRAQFVVTGSNAAMLSSDMVTLLSGRSLPLEVFPFSFREFVQCKGIDVNDPIVLAQKTPSIRHLLEEFLEMGGFPTVVIGNHKQTAFDILGAHARTVLLQDVIPRLGVRKPADLEKLYVYLVSHIGKLFSYTNLSHLFGLSDKSIKEYLQALVGAHLLYEVEAFSFSLKRQIRSQKKIYAIDTGQANAMGFKFSSNRGRLLENLVFIDIKRLGLEAYYFKTSSGREVDFVIKSSEGLSLIQVTWDLNEADAYKRELMALQEAMKELKCKKAMILIAEPMLTKEILPNGISILQAHRYLSLNSTERKRHLLSLAT